jgi:hypothetical protein
MAETDVDVQIVSQKSAHHTDTDFKILELNEHGIRTLSPPQSKAEALVTSTTRFSGWLRQYI